VKSLRLLKRKIEESKNLTREMEQLYDKILAESAQEEGLWSVQDVANYLRCNKSTVYQAYQSGKLPYRQTIGGIRFDPDEIRNHGIIPA